MGIRVEAEDSAELVASTQVSSMAKSCLHCCLCRTKISDRYRICARKPLELDKGVMIKGVRQNLYLLLF
jgi:hypothetical protein